MQEIFDKSQIKSISDLLSPVIDKFDNVLNTWISTHRWAIVPIISLKHFYPEKRYSEWILNAVSSLQYSQCYVATTPRDSDTHVYTINPLSDEITSFFYYSGTQVLALFPDTLEFVILNLPNICLIVAGPKTFVTKCVGTSLSTARTIFIEWVGDGIKRKEIENRLVHIYKRYKRTNGDILLLKESINLVYIQEKFSRILPVDIYNIRELIVMNKWVAIAIPEKIQLMESEWLALTIRQMGYTSCYVVDLGVETIKAYEVNISLDALVSIQEELCPFGFIMAPDDLSFLVYSDPEGYFFLIIGSNDFVENSIGTSIKVAMDIFQDYVEQSEWESGEISLLERVLELMKINQDINS